MAPLTLRRPIVTGPVMGPIVVKVNLKLKGAHLERDFFNKLADVHVLARTKSGYLSSVLMQSHENPLKYRLHIYFNNAADWLKWKDHAARKAVYDTVGGLLSEPYSDEMFRVVQVGSRLLCANLCQSVPICANLCQSPLIPASSACESGRHTQPYGDPSSPLQVQRR
eukprot:TRINITY_DN461_c0_g2_i1.p1 TRINITY_DN461_c0_g2~~TRINITY_DN461_c0_g2_i1.p1  ORF type:complete len:192 (+),score=23.93 TRINITY_DN461_c0_g2_i1:76-576(+)